MFTLQAMHVVSPHPASDNTIPGDYATPTKGLRIPTLSGWPQETTATLTEVTTLTFMEAITPTFSEATTTTLSNSATTTLNERVLPNVRERGTLGKCNARCVSTCPGSDNTTPGDCTTTCQ